MMAARILSTLSLCTLFRLWGVIRSRQERLMRARNAFFVFMNFVGMMHSDGLTLTHIYFLLLFALCSLLLLVFSSAPEIQEVLLCVEQDVLCMGPLTLVLCLRFLFRALMGWIIETCLVVLRLVMGFLRHVVATIRSFEWDVFLYYRATFFVPVSSFSSLLQGHSTGRSRQVEASRQTL